MRPERESLFLEFTQKSDSKESYCTGEEHSWLENLV